MRNLQDIRLFLLDMDGTIYLGNHLFPCTLPFLTCLQEQHKRFLFLTNNSSKNRNDYVKKLNQMGIVVKPDDIFTSGEATTIYLKHQKEQARVFLVGTPALEQEFQHAGFLLTDQNPDYVVLGFDTTLTYQKLWKLCDFVRVGVPYIATHPDFNCPVENGFMPDIGSMMACVQASTGRTPDIVIGKPNRMICDCIAEKYHISTRQMCMVGDRLYTDIALGENANITSILVLSGETSKEALQNSKIQPDFIFDDLSGITVSLTQQY